ncbi:MAG: S9 family peptidase [Bacteroidota bacterium]|nr:S9 family peptidase [Bacteroidota bacterium]
MRYLLSATAFIITLSINAQKSASISFEKWISLKQAGSPIVSPNGRHVAFTQTTTDWANNMYDVEIWLSQDGGEPYQLTRTNKNTSTQPRFTPDSRFISFLADRGDKPQIYLIPVTGGEAFPITKDEDGVGNYEWSPGGKQIAYLKAEPDSAQDKTIKERYGAFSVENETFRQSHLWLVNFNYDSVLLAGQLPCYKNKKDSTSGKCVELPTAKRLTHGNFTVSSFSWNPDGTTIAFTKVPDPLLPSAVHADIALVDVSTERLTSLVSNPSTDAFGKWSPDGRQFVYTSAVGDSTSYFYKNNRLFVYDVATKSSQEIAQGFDEDKNVLDWKASGIYFLSLQKTKSKLFQLDPLKGSINPVDLNIDVTSSADFSKNSDVIAVAARNYTDLNEIYVGRINQPLKKITKYTEQLAGWNTPSNEIIQWKSKDGAMVEGILLKPHDYDPSKKYPLLVVIHGGPTGVDRPEPAPTYVYPITQWCEKGALVLRVNYRGSAGYGEKFRALNVNNLGVGDMWDVLSGVEYLNKKALIDTSRMGCMGWSQGGYISAFLTTHTNIFKAISVGAGISNWITYYVSTDITPFTRQYLQSTPWANLSMYQKTSPMTTINNARTPTLIQHGELDRRVPISNAYELYRGLQDRNIPSKLVVYKGFGHGITKPKERLAAVWHNWLWFNQYVFGEKETAIPTE